MRWLDVVVTAFSSVLIMSVLLRQAWRDDHRSR
jgi:hypothetical protein